METSLMVNTKINNKKFKSDIKQMLKDLDKLSKTKKNNKKEQDKKEQDKEKNDKEKKDSDETKKTKEWDDSLGGVIKHYAKLAAVMLVAAGIAMAIAKAFEQMKTENTETWQKLEQIKNSLSALLSNIVTVLANILTPVIDTIVNIVYKLLQYINAIANAWFGINLFAGKSEKSLDKSTKSAKKLKKTLSGFDEINTIGSQSNDSGGSSGGGSAASVGGLQPLGEGELPGWVKWIADNGVAFAGIISGIAAAILLVKFGVNGLLSLGIGVIIAGIAMAIQGIIDFIKDPSWENFATILKGLAIILAGVTIAMIALNGASPVTWIMLAIAAVTALVALIIKYWDEIKTWVVEKANWFYDNVIKRIADFFVWLWDRIVSGVTAAVNWIKDIFNKVVTFFKNIINTIVTLFKNIGTKVGDAISGAFKTVINGILSAVESILNFPIKSINKLIDVINKIPGIDIGKLPTFNLPRLAKGGIVDLPRTGVNIGGAIAGEAGPEAVIPLSDNTLQRLANMIPITIDLTTELDGRILNRRLEQVRNNNSFARNGV